MATYIKNSLIVVLLSVGSQLLFSTTAGYMLSKPAWKGRRAVWILLVASMMFPFESIMVSLFLSIRDLGLVDNVVGVWLPGFVGAINVLLMRGAFLAVPREIEDSGMLDGASEGSGSATSISRPRGARSWWSPSTPSSAPGTTSSGP